MKNTEKTKAHSDKSREENSLESPAKENVAQPKEKTFEQKKAEFAKLIAGEYKEAYEASVKEKISKNLEENKALENKLKEANEILEMLSDRYGAENATELKEAITTDDSLFAEKANKYGMDVHSYRYMRNLERENAKARAQLDRSKLEAQMADKMKTWYAESGDVSAKHPDFNLAQEINNPKFIALIRSGVDMKTAYEVIHHEDILEKIRKENAAEAKKAATMELEARLSRPVENGLSSQSSAVIKKDVSLLTPEERAEIAKRAAKGEIISF